MTNPVVKNGFAWALSDGFLSCVQLGDNEPWLQRKWRQRTRFGHGQLLAVGDQLLIHGENGVLALGELDSEKFEKQAQIDTVEGFCWNTLALYGDLVLIRSERQAACYRLPIVGDPIPNTVIEQNQVAEDSTTEVDETTSPKLKSQTAIADWASEISNQCSTVEPAVAVDQAVVQ